MEDHKTIFRRKLKEELTEFLNSDTLIKMPLIADACVSIVVVTWNQAELTYACLRGLEQNITVPFELILVDNASTDETDELLGRLQGARIIKNSENVGFLLAVNQGVEFASGKHVLLLNNDAIIRTGSLEAAVTTLEADATIGAVGGPIVLLDGNLQEAGSIVWQDGTCLGYGRGRNPNDPEFQFQRDVDYCSGAFLLVRRDVWRMLGGFAEVFAPAYYEETDLCLRLQDAGYRVVYEPKAIIDHYEFGSAGQSEWAFSQQIKNQQIFCRRHWPRLKTHYPSVPANALSARIVPRQKQNVLVIDEMVPHESHGAGYPRCAEIIRTLDQEGFAVSFYPLLVPDDDWDKVYATLPSSVEVMLGLGVAGIDEFLRSRSNMYDFVVVSRPTNMEIIAGLLSKNRALFGKAKLIYDAEAMFSAREILRRTVAGEDITETEAAQLLESELSLTSFADHVITVSEEEASYFRDYKSSTVSVLGHLLDVQPTPARWDARRDLLFVGRLDGEGSPNVDSLVWFVSEVLPHITAINPDIRLKVVGKNDAPSVQSLASRNVDLLGIQQDLRPLYDQARVFIAPTRFAAGIPHKVHAAASFGLPCVATPLIVQQLGWKENVAILCGADPEAFGAGVLRIYNDELLWNSVRAEALQKVADDCGASRFRAGLMEAFNKEN
ncbi:glycosyltransferase [Rhizobium rhizogenes]|uniref:glycosyltransferase n=1 Tax=Rhizobium TaxID=379 RepID=UPI00026EE2AD|nr:MULTISPECIES: glycosyltransferase [Rhizobium]EJK80931.1 putative glycosyltransferase [Rhizobium sp. AP16]NTI24152.1 glycosyltransferase [Rhizobium rhizogenes]QTG03981.1 glycosyltransferase [Rhizobium rhizogenes]